MFGLRGLVAKSTGKRVSNPEKEVPDNAEEQKQELQSETFHQCRDRENVNDSSLTSEVNLPIAFIPLSDLPPVEAAFSIEKISKTIFSLLEPSDLLNCRLVSSSWLRMATNEKLLKMNKNVIRINRTRFTKVTTVKFEKKTLQDVADFLDALGSHPLPCSAKLNVEMTIAPNDFFEFFDRYGFVVHDFHVDFQPKENGEDFIYHKNSFLEFVAKLLLEQMPNLDTLYVRFALTAQFKGKIDPKLLQDIKNGVYFGGKKNHSLRTVIFAEEMPFEIVEAVCILAPKLERLKMLDLRFVAKNQQYIYLTKELRLTPSLDHWNEVDAFETVVTSKMKFDPETLFIQFSEVRDSPELLPRLGALLTKTFEKSCHSLEELTLTKVCFLPGTVLPRMPKVKEICFSYSKFANSLPGWSWLPQGTSLATTFPVLDTISFNGGIDLTLATNFLSFCVDEEVESVKKIFVHCNDYDGKFFEKNFPYAEVL